MCVDGLASVLRRCGVWSLIGSLRLRASFNDQATHLYSTRLTPLPCVCSAHFPTCVNTYNQGPLDVVLGGCCFCSCFRAQKKQAGFFVVVGDVRALPSRPRHTTTQTPTCLLTRYINSPHFTHLGVGGMTGGSCSYCLRAFVWGWVSRACFSCALCAWC